MALGRVIGGGWVSIGGGWEGTARPTEPMEN